MGKKFLKQLNFEEATDLVMDLGEFKEMIDEEVWVEQKYQGPRLAKIAEGNSLIIKKAKENLRLDDD